jgi:hypothetical protein
MTTMILMGIGAALMYFFDPDSGRAASVCATESCMDPLPKENRDEQIVIGLAAGRPGDRASHHLSHIQLANAVTLLTLIELLHIPGEQGRSRERGGGHGGACRPRGCAVRDIRGRAAGREAKNFHL